tara:strand:+ start:559 stop:1602 length:1044 start_codon:yes stop_codon:yes gene_type:complete
MIKLSFGKKISQNGPCFIIAEAGVNHNGKLSIAKKLVDLAVSAKADAVKFQTFLADEIILKKAPKAKYHIETTGSDNKLSWYDLLKSQEISVKMHKELIKYCKKKKIIFLSTPYDKKSCDLLDNLGVEMFKIASTDTNNYQLVKYIAKKGKPTILSTAMSNFKEVNQSYKILKKYLKNKFAIMQCTGSYPAPLFEANLNVIKTFKTKFNCLIGYSDHVLDSHAGLAATSIGISCYEKHITIDKRLPGPDHRASLNKKEFIELVKKIRKIEKSLGSFDKKLSYCEKGNIKKLRKYLVANKNINKNQKFDDNNIVFKRTGGKGISASNYFKIIKKRAKKSYLKNEVIYL